MKRLLVLLVSMMSLDGLLTYRAVTQSLAREWNQIVSPIAGDWQFVLLKVVGALACAVALWAVYRRFPRLAAIGANCVVAFYGSVLAWNLSVLLPA